MAAAVEILVAINVAAGSNQNTNTFHKKGEVNRSLPFFVKIQQLECLVSSKCATLDLWSVDRLEKG